MDTERFTNLINGINDREPLQRWLTDLQVHLNDLEAGLQPRAVSAVGEEERKLRMPVNRELTIEWIGIVQTRLEQIEGA